MAISLESISRGRARKSPRIVLLGVEKVGKSNWAASAERPVFIPIKGEQGIDELDVAKFPVCRTYSDVLEAVGVLYTSEHEFQTAVIDSSSTLEPLVWDHVSRLAGVESIEKVNGGFGKGYVEALKYWRELMDGMDALREDRGMTSILIGHVVTTEFNDPEADPYTTYNIDIQKKAASALYRWADAILFANFKRAIVQKNDGGFNKTTARGIGTGQRVLYTEKRPAHPGGTRYQGMPYELPLTWDAFRKALDASRPAPVIESTPAAGEEAADQHTNENGHPRVTPRAARQPVA